MDIYYIFTILPFMVCMIWSVIYLLEYGKASQDKRILTGFAVLSAVLYFTHAVHFSGSGHLSVVDCIWLLCSLSSYPVICLYIRQLTRGHVTVWSFVCALSLALIVSAWAWIVFFLDKNVEPVFRVAKFVFLFEVVVAAMIGFHDLNAFRRKVDNAYADTEDKRLNPVVILLVLFVVASVASSVADIIGRDSFRGSLLLAIPSVLFSSLLFAVFYIGQRVDFSIRNYEEEVGPESKVEQMPEESAKDELMKRIDTIMAESRMYLQPGLKITDVSGALCSNRTYVSNTINSVTGMTFNEYINRLRIDYAVKLFNESPDLCCIECAERCGFTSKSTFFRVFKEYTGRTPSSWRTS